MELDATIGCRKYIYLMERVYHLDEIDQVALEILKSYPNQRIFAFDAEMGSGKTTLIKALCKQLGVEDVVSSPTFAVVQEYRGNGDLPVFHMDWYRLKGEEDAIEAGVEDILNKEAMYCFIEWPQIAPGIIPENTPTISLNILSEDCRTLVVL